MSKALLSPTTPGTPSPSPPRRCGSPRRTFRRRSCCGTIWHRRLRLPRGGGGVTLYMVPIQEMFARSRTTASPRRPRSASYRRSRAAFIAIAIMISTFGCVNGLILAGGARAVRDEPGQALLQARGRRPSWCTCTPAPRALFTAGRGRRRADLDRHLQRPPDDGRVRCRCSSTTLTVVALFVLRRRRPDCCRGRTAPGAIRFSPTLYILVSTFFLYYILVGDPRGTRGIGLGLAALGLPASRLLEPSAGVNFR